MGAQPVAPGARVRAHGPADEWPHWSTTVRVVTEDPHALASARRLVDGELARVELAASRSGPDSEIRRLPAGRRVGISSTLTAILAASLHAAHETQGAVDPTVGHVLAAPGSPDRWRGIELDAQAQTVLLPRGVRLDLGPIALAWAADRCAQVVAEVLGVGVLVSLGGDIATAGPPGSSGSGAWEILIQEDPAARPGACGALIAVPTGLAVATAGSSSRPWRAVTVVTPDCVTAATWSTAALDDGTGAPEVLAARGYPARLVSTDGRVRLLGGWPDDAGVGPVAPEEFEG